MSNLKVGVFVCYCGSNINGVVDCEAVKEYASTLDGVVYAATYPFFCADPGQNMIKEAIKEHGLDRVVVSACTPKIHEPTFRTCLSDAGISPYYLEFVNIREQDSFVHMADSEAATKKAMELIAGGVERAKNLEDIPQKTVEVDKSCLVIGAGIAGIQSALDLADQGFKVYLVDKDESIGGRMAQLAKTFPTDDCALWILAPKMVTVANHPNVEVITYAEVKNIDGYIGNFDITLEKKPRYVSESTCTGCGACAAVCPIEVPNEFDCGLGMRKAIYAPFPQAVPLVYTIDKEHCIDCKLCDKACGPNAIDYNQQPEEINLKVGTIITTTGYDEFDASLKEEYGYGVYDNVITTLEIERMINPAGPTGGHEIRPSDGKAPKKTVYIQCVGSRDAKVGNPYCSRICCMFSLKNAQLMKMHDPDSEVYICYMDIRAYGKGYEEYYQRAQEQFGVRFIRGRPAQIIEDPETKNLKVLVEDTLLGEVLEIDADLVVLSAGLVPKPDTKRLAKLMGLDVGPEGFLKEFHPKLAPVNTKVEGIAIAGLAQGPKDIPDTVAQAKGAASAVAIPMSQGQVNIEMIRVVVNEDICGACGICAPLCPYNAIKYENDLAVVDDIACKGCGSCAGACPSGAMQLRYYRDEQILSSIDGMLDTHKCLEQK